MPGQSGVTDAFLDWWKNNRTGQWDMQDYYDWTYADGDPQYNPNVNPNMDEIVPKEDSKNDDITLEWLKQKVASDDFDLSSLSRSQIAGAFGFEDSDYGEFFSEYDPWKAEYREQQYNKRWGTENENSLYNLRKQKLGTQKQQSLGKLNLQQEGLTNKIQSTRRGTANTLFDLGRQQRGKAAQSGFSNSGGLLSAQNQQRDRIMANYGSQMQGFGLQRQQIGLEREGIKTRYNQNISQLNTQRGLADIGYQRDIESYERDWFEKLTQKATNLIQSGASNG